jgi:nucleoid-associated protein EbfC
MNIQAMMKQAQKMQEEMIKIKEEIDKKIFPGKYSFVEIEVNGKKELLKVKIDRNMKLSADDLEMLEDMIVVAVNEAFKKVDKETEEKMGKFNTGLQGLM